MAGVHDSNHGLGRCPPISVAGALSALGQGDSVHPAKRPRTEIAAGKDEGHGAGPRRLADYGLPPFVVNGYNLRRRVSTLYPWQSACLNVVDVLVDRPTVGQLHPGGACARHAVRPKNLVYTAPTSGGKTLVAEVIALHRILCEPGTGLPAGHNRRARAIFAVPYKSLVAEMAEQLRRLLNPLTHGARSKATKYRVAAMFGNNDPLLGDAAIAVCTFERAHSLVSHIWREFDEASRTSREDTVIHPSEIRCVVVDEVHMLSDETRGPGTEGLLAKLLAISAPDGPAPDLQIVCMSATLPNVPHLAQFMRAALFQSTYRPVPLTEYILVGFNLYQVRHTEADHGSTAIVQDARGGEALQSVVFVRSYGVDEAGRPGISASAPPLSSGSAIRRLVPGKPIPITTLDPTLIVERAQVDNMEVLLCAETVCEGGQVLVFKPNRSDVERTAKQIADKLQGQVERMQGGGLIRGREGLDKFTVPFFLPTNQKLRIDAIAQIRTPPDGVQPSKIAVESLCPLLHKGVAFHHAGLSELERSKVEDLFLRQAIVVLVSTSTLAAGVNLPARRVLIAPTIASSVVDSTRYRQMAGRAGRAGMASSACGESIVMVAGTPYQSSLTAAQQKDYVKNALNMVLSNPKPVYSRMLPNGILEMAGHQTSWQGSLAPRARTQAVVGSVRVPSWSQGTAADFAQLLLDMVVCHKKPRGISIARLNTFASQHTFAGWHISNGLPLQYRNESALFEQGHLLWMVSSCLWYMRTEGLISIISPGGAPAEPEAGTALLPLNSIVWPGHLARAASDAGMKPHEASLKYSMLMDAQRLFLIRDSMHALYLCARVHIPLNLDFDGVKHWKVFVDEDEKLKADPAYSSALTTLMGPSCINVDMGIVRHLLAGTPKNRWPYPCNLVNHKRVYLEAATYARWQQLASAVLLEPFLNGMRPNDALAHLLGRGINVTSEDLLVLLEQTVASARAVTIFTDALNWEVLSRFLGAVRDRLARRKPKGSSALALAELPGIEQQWRASALEDDGVKTFQGIHRLSPHAIANIFLVRRPYQPMAGMQAARAHAAAFAEELACAERLWLAATARLQSPALLPHAPSEALLLRRPLINTGGALRAMESGGAGSQGTRYTASATFAVLPHKHSTLAGAIRRQRSNEGFVIARIADRSSVQAGGSSVLVSRMLGEAANARIGLSLAPRSHCQIPAIMSAISQAEAGGAPILSADSAVDTFEAAHTLRQRWAQMAADDETSNCGDEDEDNAEGDVNMHGQEDSDDNERDEKLENIVNNSCETADTETLEQRANWAAQVAFALSNSGPDLPSRSNDPSISTPMVVSALAIGSRERNSMAPTPPSVIHAPSSAGSSERSTFIHFLPSPGISPAAYNTVESLVHAIGEDVLDQLEKAVKSFDTGARAVTEVELDCEGDEGAAQEAAMGLNGSRTLHPLDEEVFIRKLWRPDPIHFSTLNPMDPTSVFVHNLYGASAPTRPATDASSGQDVEADGSLGGSQQGHHYYLHTGQESRSSLHMVLKPILVEGGQNARFVAIHRDDLRLAVSHLRTSRAFGSGTAAGACAVHSLRVGHPALPLQDTPLESPDAIRGRMSFNRVSMGPPPAVPIGGEEIGPPRPLTTRMRQAAVGTLADSKPGSVGSPLIASGITSSGHGQDLRPGGHEGAQMPLFSGVATRQGHIQPVDAASLSSGKLPAGLSRPLRRSVGAELRTQPIQPSWPLCLDTPFLRLMTLVKQQRAFAVQLRWTRAPNFPIFDTPAGLAVLEGGTVMHTADLRLQKSDQIPGGLWMPEGLWAYTTVTGLPAEAQKILHTLQASNSLSVYARRHSAPSAILTGMAIVWGATPSRRYYLPLAPALPTAFTTIAAHLIADPGGQRLEGMRMQTRAAAGATSAKRYSINSDWSALPLRALALVCHFQGFGRADVAIANEKVSPLMTLGYNMQDPRNAPCKPLVQGQDAVCRTWAVAYRLAYTATVGKRWQALAELFAESPGGQRRLLVAHNAKGVIRALRDRGLKVKACEVADPVVAHWLQEPDKVKVDICDSGAAIRPVDDPDCDDNYSTSNDAISVKMLSEKYVTESSVRECREEHQRLTHVLTSTEVAGPVRCDSSPGLLTRASPFVPSPISSSAGLSLAHLVPYLVLDPGVDEEGKPQGKNTTVNAGIVRMLVEYSGPRVEGGRGKGFLHPVIPPISVPDPPRIACLKGAVITWVTMAVLGVQLRTRRFDVPFRLVEMPVMCVLAECEGNGIGVDEMFLRRSIDMAEKKQKVIASAARNLLARSESETVRALRQDPQALALKNSIDPFSGKALSRLVYDGLRMADISGVLQPLLERQLRKSAGGPDPSLPLLPTDVTLHALEQWENRSHAQGALRAIAALTEWNGLDNLARTVEPQRRAAIDQACSDLLAVGTFTRLILEHRQIANFIGKQAKAMLHVVLTGGAGVDVATYATNRVATDGQQPSSTHLARDIRLLGCRRVRSSVETLSATGRVYFTSPNLQTLQKEEILQTAAHVSLQEELTGDLSLSILSRGMGTKRRANAVEVTGPQGERMERVHHEVALAEQAEARAFVVSAGESRRAGRVMVTNGTIVKVHVNTSVAQAGIMPLASSRDVQETPAHTIIRAARTPATLSAPAIPSCNSTGYPMFDPKKPLAEYWGACGFPYAESSAASVFQVLVELDGVGSGPSADASALMAVDEEAGLRAVWPFPADQVFRFNSPLYLPPSSHLSMGARFPWTRPVVIKLRDAVVASKGCVLLSADYASVEVRLLAYFSGDENLNNVLKGPVDVFKGIASGWTNKAADKVTKEERQHTKHLVYGVLYGMGSETMSKRMGVTRNVAQMMQIEFWRAFPGVKKFLQDVGKEACEKHWVETLLGRRRYFEKPADEKARSRVIRQSVNTVCQASAADLIKLAMQNIFSRIPRLEREWKQGMRCNSFDQVFMTQAGNCAAGFGSSQRIQLAATQPEISCRPTDRPDPVEVLATTCRPLAEPFYPPVRLVLQIHDELLFEVRVSNAEIDDVRRRVRDEYADGDLSTMLSPDYGLQASQSFGGGSGACTSMSGRMSSPVDFSSDPPGFLAEVARVIKKDMEEVVVQALPLAEPRKRGSASLNLLVNMTVGEKWGHMASYP